MSNNIKNRIDDALIAFYKEVDKDALADMLKDDVSDIDAYNKKKKQLVFLARAKAQKERNDNLLKLVSKFQQAIEANIEKPVAMLKQFIQGNASLALYRNLDKLSKEDIIEIIKDQNFVQLIEELENDEKRQ
ncbi:MULTISPECIES: hypothetical protein [Bacteroidota]|jgi:hypothetical protein|uniref:Uncharacterized protein n=2 Tax=Cyclobacteriaceae TaxID=563798 RepID=L0G281_ECHVK|nr:MULTISPECIES: hypothetical protein [Bacteroidota]MBR9776280.1 hypothetical protein [Cytophagales bacterium]AGA79423.1 hypothetical protein Echvi_3191 [Echinicola vietnamensis DSM 17526]MBB6325405.1 hypothetical protein [Algoriphagus iocasae]MBD3629905.1 hypothetical protein [Cyclobacterium sp.]MEC3880262.1 hypothetical protein [Parapedobacter sp. 10938]|tara:strand:- start:15584 stop:15979 length:396 start_codon:yes stop_codon:yes gene_type:complete